MPTTTSHEQAKAAAAKTAGTKAAKSSTGNIMDDAPLFAGLDDFVLIQTEKKKTRTPKAVQPEEKTEAAQPVPAASGAPLPRKTLRARKTKQPGDPNALLLSVAEMCALLKISRATLIRMDKAGKIPGRIKLGGSVRFHRETVESWLRNLLTAPSA